MPRTAYQMPVRTDLAARVGPRLWRKTILRPGHISKGGIDLDVDRPYLESLVRSFKSGAKDQVQFVEADANNRHNEAPNRYRGAVVDLNLTADDRLEALVAVTAKGDALLDDNPQLGISPSLESNFARADGRAADAVLLHVCGTLDPEISRLGGWARADLSASYDEVIDLTFAEVTDPATHAAARTGGDPQRPEGGAPMPTLSDEDRQTLDQLGGLLPGLNSLFTRFGGAAGQSTSTDNADGDTDTSTSTGRGAASGARGSDHHDTSDTAESGDGDTDDVDDVDVEEFTDEELDAMAAGVEATDVDTAGAEGTGRRVAASAGTQINQLKLSHDRLARERDQDKIELARLRKKDDEREYEVLRDQLARQHHVPPRVTDLCRELLEGSGPLELSAGKKVDARSIVTKALREFAAIGPLDLSAPVGSAHELDAKATEADARKARIAAIRETGFGQ